MQWGELPALQPDAITGYSLIPSRTTRLKYNNYDYIIKTNSLGLASPEISLNKDTDEYRIFIIGDAFTMPEGMEYESSYPYLLEEKLRKSYPDRHINIINGGVTGYGPNEFLAHLDKYIDTIKPNLVINQFFVNEFEEVNFELHSRNAGIGFDLKKSLRSYYLANTQLPAHYRKFIEQLFNHENASYRYWKSLIYLYEKDSPLYSVSVLVKIDDYLSKIQTLCHEKNSELMVMFVPGQIAVSEPRDIDYFPHSLDINDTLIYSFEKPNRIIREICTTKGILFTDLTDTLKNHHNQPVYFPESWHWNSEGHKVAAQKLFEEIITLKFNSYEK